MRLTTNTRTFGRPLATVSTIALNVGLAALAGLTVLVAFTPLIA